jgi:predicted Rossmann fold nucleotide-binding protein DprA/Smf involved in DNA uptake
MDSQEEYLEKFEAKKQQILEYLEKVVIAEIDELKEVSNSNYFEIPSLLLSLELEDRIVQLPKKHYRLPN